MPSNANFFSSMFQRGTDYKDPVLCERFKKSAQQNIN